MKIKANFSSLSLVKNALKSVKFVRRQLGCPQGNVVGFTISTVKFKCVGRSLKSFW